MKKAVVLLSGGLDSSTVLAIAQSESYACTALSFNYFQKNIAEVNAAQHIAHFFNVVEHKTLTLPFDALLGSALLDPTIPILDHQPDGGIPNTYVPARNTIFLSFALSLAEVIGAQAIFAGFCNVDYSGYPDCRPDYIHAYQQMANLSNQCGRDGKPISIIAPLVNLTKAQTIQRGIALGVPYANTVSCYRATAEGLACGTCDSCHYRKNGFAEAKVNDPTQYVAIM